MIIFNILLNCYRCIKKTMDLQKSIYIYMFKCLNGKLKICNNFTLYNMNIYADSSSTLLLYIINKFISYLKKANYTPICISFT